MLEKHKFQCKEPSQKVSYSFIIGKCLDMCPSKERLMRERESILHKFEWADEPIIKKQVQSRKQKFENDRARRVKRKADISTTVKAFTRSAAGLDKTSPDDLRPAPILEKTVQYLYTKVLTKRSEAFHIVYDFVFDRLRSVRQDLVIQRITGLPAIRILESIIRFHVYSAYRCRNESITIFDTHTNRKHMIDNLKRLLWLYEINEYWEKSRSEFETLYLILIPNSAEVLMRALTHQSNVFFRDDTNYKCAIEMCFSYQYKNYINYYKNLKQLSPFLISAAFEHSKTLRGNALQTISKAFGCSTCKFPLTVLKSTLLYQTLSQMENDLKYLSVQISPSSSDSKNTEKYAIFKKNNVFTCSQLEGISSDLEPISREGNIFLPEQIDNVAKMIWPYQILSNDAQEIEETKQDYWFGGSSDEEILVNNVKQKISKP